MKRQSEQAPAPEKSRPGPEIRVAVKAEHQISHARQAVLQVAGQTGMRRVTAYYVATAASELASNLVFHGGGGSLSVRQIAREGRWGIELEAVDCGPGIADIELALRDGYTTRGGLGAGLGGVRRLMDGFEIDSAPGQGTRIRAWKWQA